MSHVIQTEFPTIPVKSPAVFFPLHEDEAPFVHDGTVPPAMDLQMKEYHKHAEGPKAAMSSQEVPVRLARAFGVIQAQLDAVAMIHLREFVQ